MTDQETQIPEGWRVTTLGEFLTVKHGFAFSGEGITDIENENILLTPGNFLIGGGWKDGRKYFHGDISKDYILKAGDLVVTMTDLSKDGDTLGYPAIIPRNPKVNYLHNQRVGLIKIGVEYVDKKYIYYVLKCPAYQKFIVNTASGSTVRHTSPTKIESYEIVLPPLSEQRAIAAVLSSLDDKIELLREQNKTLESIAQTIFKEWFIEFNFPDENGKPYKSSGGNMIDSELGEIPKGWKVGTLSEFVNIDPKEKVSKSVTYLFFDMKCLSTNSMEVLDGEYRSVNSGSIFKEHDTLLAKITPCLENGKTGFIFDIHGASIARGSTEFVVMRALEGMSPYFVYCLARSDNFREYAIKSMTGTSGRQRVQVEQIKKYALCLNESVLKSFDSVSKPTFEKIKINTIQIRSLAKIRNSVLPKLMKGELQIKWLDR